MRVFDGDIGVLDGQLWIASEADDIGPDMFAAFSGQQHGLLGAAEDGMLRLITGVAHGDARLSVHVVEREPQLDESWEDCVEVSLGKRSGCCVVRLGRGSGLRDRTRRSVLSRALRNTRGGCEPRRYGKGGLQPLVLARKSGAGRNHQADLGVGRPTGTAIKPAGTNSSYSYGPSLGWASVPEGPPT
jgi:hypothetical protein